MIKSTKQVQGSITAMLVNDMPSIDLPVEVKKGIEIFKNSEDKFEYFKLPTQTYFLVKSQDDLEKMRVLGFDIRQKLDRKEKQITFVGNSKNILALVEGFVLSNYQFLKYFKDADEKVNLLEDVFLLGNITEDEINEINNTTKAVFWSRDMINEPQSYLNAVTLANEMEKIAKDANISISVLDKEKIESLNMGGLLAVNRGSIQPPTFTIMEYKPEKPVNKKPVVLVGKGVVYDTGGLSLKPTANSMDLMKSDMGGAAMMAGGIYAAALNKLNVHIVALIPATDNRPGLDAYAPGDVVTMMDGTTVEVLNTDAEGRMILADGITYAKKYDPELILNAATLTGAALVAVGTRAACLMSNAKDEVNNQLISSGETVYERMVRLPLWDDYKEQLKSSIADLKNIGGRTAGTITAGKFLEHFAEAPFVHIDIAGPAYTSAMQNYKGNGGTGTGVRMLVDFFKNYKS